MLLSSPILLLSRTPLLYSEVFTRLRDWQKSLSNISNCQSKNWHIRNWCLHSLYLHFRSPSHHPDVIPIHFLSVSALPHFPLFSRNSVRQRTNFRLFSMHCLTMFLIISSAWDGLEGGRTTHEGARTITICTNLFSHFDSNNQSPSHIQWKTPPPLPSEQSQFPVSLLHSNTSYHSIALKIVQGSESFPLLHYHDQHAGSIWYKLPICRQLSFPVWILDLLNFEFWKYVEKRGQSRGW